MSPSTMKPTIASFPQFNAFPPEIQAMIVEQCSPNDQICIRLTCKYLYHHTTAPKKLGSLNDTDSGPLCGNKEPVPPLTAYGYAWQHRQECHKKSYEMACERNEQLGRAPPTSVKRCRTHWRSQHCECYTKRTKLHYRLRTWMPKGLNYCGQCAKFTKRKRGHNGRCYHGRPKERKCESNYWTHTSRNGAFGRKIWKKWFNNRAMNKMEHRLASNERQRPGSERYSLRSLPAADIDTQEVRDSRSHYHR